MQNNISKEMSDPPVTNLSSEMLERIRKRKFTILDRKKQSEPNWLDDYSPRSASSFADLGDAIEAEQGPSSQPLGQSVSIQIEDEFGATIDHDLTDTQNEKPAKPPEDDAMSHLSFNILQKLHHIPKEIRRRTSAVEEALIQEAEEDETASTMSATVKEQRRTSLMSLIGLTHREGSASDNDDHPGILGKWLPSSIAPFGNFYKKWLVVVSLAFVYNAFVIPMRSSYPYQTKSNLVYWLLADYLCDAIYLFDMFYIKARLRFVKEGISVKGIKETWNNYVRNGSFISDALSILPGDFLFLIFGHKPMFRYNRVLKIKSYWHLFDIMDNSVSNPYAVRIARTLSYMIYIIHCNSCVYYILSAKQAFGQIAYEENGKYYLNKWVYNNQGNAYIRCFYFTAAVATSTGNNPAPTNVFEYIYMTFSWMMGVFVFALLLGQIRDIVSNANRNREDYQRSMDAALARCKQLGVPKTTLDRVRQWFIYTWEQQKTLTRSASDRDRGEQNLMAANPAAHQNGLYPNYKNEEDEKRLIDRLPIKLQTDLALSVHYNTLDKVQLFKDCDRALLRDLVLKLRPIIYLPGDIVCEKGEVGKEMFIVNQGVLEVVGGEHHDKHIAFLKQGSVLGEISLLAIGGNNRRTATIKAKGYVTLFSLAKDDLNDVIRYYPQAQKVLRSKAAAILNKDKVAQGDEPHARKKGLEETCKISGLGTPRMVDAVLKTLQPGSPITQQLKEAAEAAEKEKNKKSFNYPPIESEDESQISEFGESDMEDVPPLEESDVDESREEATTSKNKNE